MINHDVLFKLHPEIAVIRGDYAFDSNGNEIIYDKNILLLEQSKADNRSIILAQIAELEAQQARPLREIALGDTTYAVTKLQSLNNQIAALRAQLV